MYLELYCSCNNQDRACAAGRVRGRRRCLARVCVCGGRRRKQRWRWRVWRRREPQHVEHTASRQHARRKGALGGAQGICADGSGWRRPADSRGVSQRARLTRHGSSFRDDSVQRIRQGRRWEDKQEGVYHVDGCHAAPNRPRGADIDGVRCVRLEQGRPAGRGRAISCHQCHLRHDGKDGHRRYGCRCEDHCRGLGMQAARAASLCSRVPLRSHQPRACAQFKHMDTGSKGYVTKEDYMRLANENPGTAWHASAHARAPLARVPLARAPLARAPPHGHVAVVTQI